MRFSIELLKAFVVTGYIFLCIATPAIAETTDIEKVLNVSQEMVLPDPEVLADIQNKADNIETDADALGAGLQSALYKSSLDIPITRFVLGNLRFDLTGLASALQLLQNKINQVVWESYTATDEAYADLIFGGTGATQVESSSATTDTNIDWTKVEDLLNGVAKIFTVFQVRVPLLLLCFFFVVQLCVIMYHYALGTDESAHISILYILPRFMLFFMLVVTYQQWVSAAITMTNYVENFICSYDAQKQIMDIIYKYATTSIDSSGWNIPGILLYFFKWLTYVCIMIMLVVRDVLLAITVLVGGLCMALGFVTTYSSNDPMREYLSGWFKAFIKLLMWGIFASTVIFALGVLTLLRASGSIGVMTAAIFALSSLYVAKDLPNLSEKMSGLALTSLIATVAPALSGATSKILPYATGMALAKVASSASQGVASLANKAQETYKQMSGKAPLAQADTGVRSMPSPIPVNVAPKRKADNASATENPKTTTTATANKRSTGDKNKKANIWTSSMAKTMGNIHDYTIGAKGNSLPADEEFEDLEK
jgi:hypothetical protein